MFWFWDTFPTAMRGTPHPGADRGYPSDLLSIHSIGQ